MKYLIAISFVFLSFAGFCQVEETRSRQNILFIEGGGAVIAGVGLGYERYFAVAPNKRFSLRAGLGGVDHFNKISYFTGGSFIVGKRSGLEIGVNYLVDYDATTFRFADDEKFENGIQTLIGYRYQNWNNGVLFRVFYVPPIGCCGSFIPLYGGVSAGYAF